jgi:hypothetical protein
VNVTEAMGKLNLTSYEEFRRCPLSALPCPCPALLVKTITGVQWSFVRSS